MTALEMRRFATGPIAAKVLRTKKKSVRMIGREIDIIIEVYRQAENDLESKGWDDDRLTCSVGESFYSITSKWHDVSFNNIYYQPPNAMPLGGSSQSSVHN